MRGKKRIPARVIMTLLMGIIGFFLFGFILTRAQSRLFLINIQEEMIDSADYIVRARSNAGIGGYALENWAQRNRLFFADMIDFMGENDPEFKLDQAHLQEINSLLGTQDIMIVDKSGDVLTSATGRFDSLKGEDYAPLFETFETGEVSRMSVFPWSFSMLQSRAEVLSRDDPRRLRDEAALDGEEALAETGRDVDRGCLRRQDQVPRLLRAVHRRQDCAGVSGGRRRLSDV